MIDVGLELLDMRQLLIMPFNITADLTFGVHGERRDKSTWHASKVGNTFAMLLSHGLFVVLQVRNDAGQLMLDVIGLGHELPLALAYALRCNVDANSQHSLWLCAPFAVRVSACVDP